MARYIDADRLIKGLRDAVERNKPNEIAKDIVNDVINLLQNEPTADVVEVVRCEKCDYKDDCARQIVHTTRDYVLEQNMSTYNKVDFCSYGERKDGKDINVPTK